MNASTTPIATICMTLDLPKRRRRRLKQTTSLGERLLRAAREARDAAKQLPPGVDQARLLRRAREAEAVAQLDAMLKR
jgi:hypothetical protein